MVVRVSDTASHRRDQIANLAELLRKRPTAQHLIKAVYFGKARRKSVPFLAQTLSISTKRVTEIAKPFVNSFFSRERGRENGKVVTFYAKDDFVRDNLSEILRLVNDKKEFDAYHTKTQPKITIAGKSLRIVAPFTPRTHAITIDDVKEFARVRKIIGATNSLAPSRLPESAVKRGIVRLLGEELAPKDWGGESNDIFTTRITIAGRRRRGAFALKGPAKIGPLVPRMMGRNGDQIQRLFASPAQVFFVQYEGEIKESIIQQMSQLALAKAVTEREVYYGVIDRQDTYRLRLAYPKNFRK